MDLQKNVIRTSAKAVVALLMFVSVAFGLTLLVLNYVFGIGVMRRAPHQRFGNMRTSQRPSAAVRVVSPAPTDLAQASSVPIMSLADIYASIGASEQDFADWEHAFGMDSLGRTPDGRPFIAGYPIFSKVAWMYIEPVTLTRAETAELVDEIARAQAQAVNSRARLEFQDMAALARTALSRDAVLMFGPP